MPSRLSKQPDPAFSNDAVVLSGTAANGTPVFWAIIDSMELWTGLMCVVADPNCRHFRRFGDGKGAYVNIVAWAESADHFQQRVTSIAKEQLDCIVREVEQVELLAVALHREGCPAEFFTMRTTAERQPNDVISGTFHIWNQYDVN